MKLAWHVGNRIYAEISGSERYLGELGFFSSTAVGIHQFDDLHGDMFSLS